MLPEHLKIGYEIIRVGVQLGDECSEGDYNPDAGTIQVAARLTPRRRVEALLHEILHACWDHARLPDGADTDLSGLREEDVVGRIAGPLAAVLFDNASLLDCLNEAGLAGNSTCYQPREPVPFTAKEVEDAMHHGFKNLHERIANSTVEKLDNERRSVQSKLICEKETTCSFPNCYCSTVV